MVATAADIMKLKVRITDCNFDSVSSARELHGEYGNCRQSPASVVEASSINMFKKQLDDWISDVGL